MQMQLVNRAFVESDYAWIHMVLKVVPIGGMCLGIEVLWNLNVVVIDLLVVRFYIGKPKRV